MKRSTAFLLLGLIFAIVLFSRLMIAFQTESFSYSAYFSLRQVENINEQALPLFEDSLSYSGRSHLFPPIFYYVLSLFSFIGVGFAAKIIPNMFSVLVVVLVYFISFNLVKNRLIALTSAFFAGFIPLFFSNVISISPYSLATLLIFFVVYYFMNIENKSYLNPLLFFLVVLVLSHASSLLLVISLLVFLLLLKIESNTISKKEQEFILFSSFLVLWFYFLVYKNAFLIHGPFVIWQNIPLELLTNYFFDLNLFESIYSLGLVPVIFGAYSIYYVLFKYKMRNALLIIGMFFTVLLLLWLKLIQFQIGLVFIGICLVILSSISIKNVYYYFQKTKIPNLGNWFLTGLFVLFFLTSIISSFNIGIGTLENAPSESEIQALLWLKNNTPEDSVVLGRLEEGHIINYFANRKNVLDNNFLLVEDASQRYKAVNEIFSLRLLTEAVRRLNNYGVDYIYFSPKFIEADDLYYSDADCLKEIYNKDSIKIYEVECVIE